jgi:hypothetical protein
MALAEACAGLVSMWDGTCTFHPTDPYLPARNLPQVRNEDVVARTVNFAERMLPYVQRDWESYIGIRRFVLNCLAGLLRPGGRIEQLRMPDSEVARVFRAEQCRLALSDAETKTEAARRREERSIRYRQRAMDLQQCYHSGGHAVDPVALAGQFNAHPDSTWSPLSLPDACLSAEALHERFGPRQDPTQGRSPWSARLVSDASIGYADDQDGQRLWQGDLWLLPPEGVVDPRRGAADVARTHHRRVGAYLSTGAPLWVIDPDGHLDLAPAGLELARSRGRELESCGWPEYREWPAYPAEVAVRPLR